MMFASKRRSLLKTLSWRTIASLDTLLLTWLVTGSIAAGLTISGLEIITKMILYYFHERTWIKCKYDTNTIKNYYNYKCKYGIDKNVKKVIEKK